jgi:hypothetical protein
MKVNAKSEHEISVNELGAVFAFDYPESTSKLNVALFSVDLLEGPDIQSALGFLGITNKSPAKLSATHAKYIFGLAYAGGRDYLEVSALEFSEGTYICGIEHGPHFDASHDDAIKALEPKLDIREARGSVSCKPFTLLPPAEPSWGDEDDEDFEEDEARRRNITINLSGANFRRIMFLREAWRQAIDYFPMHEDDDYRPATLKQPVKDIRKHMIPFEKKKSNCLWFKNWALANFAELNSDWDAFPILRKAQGGLNLSRRISFS